MTRESNFEKWTIANHTKLQCIMRSTFLHYLDPFIIFMSGEIKSEDNGDLDLPMFVDVEISVKAFLTLDGFVE